jgi:alanyl-tRNA synthetase
MQFFGDKYRDRVRVVQIGGQGGALNGFSMELCGGTHARATGEVGSFRIVAESAIAAGVRRIEAVAGLRAYDRARADSDLLGVLAARLNAPAAELEKKLEALLAQQKEMEKLARAAEQQHASDAARSLVARAKRVGELSVIVENIGEGTGDYVQMVADALKSQFTGVVFLAGTAGGAVSLVATVSPSLTASVQAGKLVQVAAPLVGGKGGGRPDNARGGGKGLAGLAEALQQVRKILGLT